MRVEEGYISCLDNIDLILLCDTLFIPFHRQFIDSQFSKDPYPTPHLYSVGDDCTMHNRNMKHARAIEFDYTNLCAMLSNYFNYGTNTNLNCYG